MAINDQSSQSGTGTQKDASKMPGSFKPITDDKKATSQNSTDRSSSKMDSTPDEITPPQKQPDHPTKEEGDVVPSYAGKSGSDLSKNSKSSDVKSDKWEDKH